MAELTPEARLTRELIYYAGHGYTGANAPRYETLLNLPRIHGGLPVGATALEVARHIDDVLIATIARIDQPSYLSKLERELSASDLRRLLTELMGLPPHQRAKDLERHRQRITGELAAGSVSTWRRRGGVEEQLVGVLARRLQVASGQVSRWLVRESRLHYFFGEARSIERLECRYDIEVLVDGVRTFGVDHRSTAAGVAARYNIVEGSMIGAPDRTTESLTDGSLSIDLLWHDELRRGDRLEVGYDLVVNSAFEAFQLLRLNAAVEVWAHDLTISFTPGFLPPRVWWFAHHVGVGAGEVPTHHNNDLSWHGTTVHQRFSGLRQGPDYGAAWTW